MQAGPKDTLPQVRELGYGRDKPASDIVFLLVQCQATRQKPHTTLPDVTTNSHFTSEFPL